MLKPVIQEESTGCGIAAVANILGKTYAQMKAIANAMGIYAMDTSLWSDTQYVRRMLASAGVASSINSRVKTPRVNTGKRKGRTSTAGLPSFANPTLMGAISNERNCKSAQTKKPNKAAKAKAQRTSKVKEIAIIMGGAKAAPK